MPNLSRILHNSLLNRYKLDAKSVKEDGACGAASIALLYDVPQPQIMSEMAGLLQVTEFDWAPPCFPGRVLLNLYPRACAISCA